MKNRRVIRVVIFAACAAAPGIGWAGDATPSLRSYYFDGASDPIHSANTYDPSGAPSLSNGYTGTWGSAYDTVTYGSDSVSVTGAAQSSPSKGATAVAHGIWRDAITINNDSYTGETGTAVFTYHLTGSMTTTGDLSSSSPLEEAAFIIDEDGSPLYQGGVNSSYNGTATTYQALSSFDYSRPFTFGSALSTSTEMEATIGTGGAKDTYAAINLTLSLGGITVYNSSGVAVSYSSFSALGDAHTGTVAHGSSFSGFTLANTDASGAHHSTLSLLGGTASTDELVNATFDAAPAGSNYVSDAVTLNGTGSDLHVVQLTYDPTALSTAGIDPSTLQLLWFNSATQTWMNSVYGDSDGGASQHGVIGAYDPATDFALGDYGVDPNTDTVWAVVDHNSEYVAGTPAPEPMSGIVLLQSIGMIAG